MLDKSQQWIRMLAERAGVQVRGPKYHGISVGFDIKRSFLQNPAVIFDVGAHRGESLYEFVNWFPRAHVYCFEPGAQAYAALCKRARRNHRVTCIKAALGDKVGERILYVRRSTDNSSLSNYESEHPLEDLQAAETVRVSTIDNHCATEGIDRIDLLKVDTEGLDLNVLSGGAAMFGRHAIGIVQVEAGISPENKKHVPFQEFNEFFLKYDYCLFGIYEQTLEWTTGRSVLRRCNPVFISPELCAHEEGSIDIGDAGPRTPRVEGQLGGQRG
jgi:FkbM family methyltransferase